MFYSYFKSHQSSTDQNGSSEEINNVFGSIAGLQKDFLDYVTVCVDKRFLVRLSAPDCKILNPSAVF